MEWLYGNEGFFLPILLFLMDLKIPSKNPSHNACQWCWGWCTCTPRCFQQLKHSSSKDSYHQIPSFIWDYHTIPKKKHIQKKSETLRLNLCPNEGFIKPTPKHFRPLFGVLFVATIFLKVRAERRSVAVTLSSEGSVTFRTGKVQHASAARSW